MRNIITPLLALLAICCSTTLEAQAPSQDDPATWVVNPADFLNNMFVTATVEISGVESTDPNDMVAVFIQGTDDLRGVGNLNYLQAFDKHFVSIFVYSNDEGLPLEMVVYDASEDFVLPSTNTTPPNTVTYSSNTSLGGYTEPFYVIKTISIEANFTKEDVLCTEDDNGYIKAIPSGGTSPYDFAWSTGATTTGATTDSIGGLSAGQYFLTITDANNYTKVDSVEIINLNRTIEPPVLAAAPDEVVCEGSDVYLFAFSSEVENPTYEWYDNFGNFIQSDDGLFIPDIDVSRQYDVQTNVRNCLSEFSTIDVTVLPVPDPEFAVSNFEVAPQEGIVFNPVSANEPVTFNWNFGDGNTSDVTTPTHAYEEEGIYIVTLSIITVEGCIASAQETILVEERYIDILLEQNDPDCPADDSGSIIAQAINGAPPYNYEWSNGAMTSSVEGLTEGDYTLTVTDADGNSRITTITLEAADDIPVPDLVVNSGNVVCSGDDIWINAFSGRQGAQFFWFIGALDNNPVHVGPTLFMFDVQGVTTYYVETQVGNCASGRTPVTIQASDPDASFSTNKEVSFITQAIQFSVDNPTFGIEYTWDWGDNTPNSSITSILHTFDVAGIYEVSLTARSLITGCEDVEIIRIQIVDLPNGGGTNDAPLSALPLADPAKCQDSPTGQLSAFAIGGNPPYSYQWSNGSSAAFQTGIAPGTYFVTVTDSDGTEAVASAVVGVESDIEAPVAIVNGGQEICLGEPAWLAATSGDPNATYQWYLDLAAPSPAYIGESIQVSGLQEQDTIYLLASSTGCFSEIVPVPLEYAVADAGFSVDLPTVEVGQTASFVADSISINYEYEWSFGDGGLADGSTATHTYAQPGLYEVYLTVETNSGCSSSQRRFINVFEPQQSLYLTFNLDHPYCTDDETGGITAQAFGGQPPYSYQWSNGAATQSLLGVGTGTYSLTITDALGQTAENSTQLMSLLGDIEAPQVAVEGDGIACENGNAWLSATGGAPGTQYYWYDSPSGGSLQFVGSYLELNNLTDAQAYFVEARYEGCTSNDRTAIFVDVETADASFTADPLILPVGEVIDLTALGGNQNYTWNFGDGNSSNGGTVDHNYQQAGIYTLTLTAQSASGCEATQSRTIQVLPMQALQLAFSVAEPGCFDSPEGSIAVTVSGGVPPYEFNWSNGATGNSLNALLPGDYEVTVSDMAGNELNQLITIESEVPEITMESVSIAQGAISCPGTPITLLATSNVPGADYRWYNEASGGDLLYIGAAFPTIAPPQNTTYYVEAVSGNCSTANRSPLEVAVDGPDAGFTVSPDMLLAGQEATFVPDDMSDNLAYAWDFGDGNNSGQQSPVHTYIEDGLFLASLTVRDTMDCEVTEKQTVSVGFGQALGLVLEATDVQCAGDSTGTALAQVVNGVPPYSYEWSNGATDAVLQNIVEGTYQVTVTDAMGTTAEGAISINSIVGTVPLPQVVANNSIVCPDEYLVLYAYDNTGTATNFYWYPGPNSTVPIGTGSSYSQLGLSASTESFFVEAANGACRSNGRTSVTVSEDDPNAGFTVSSNTLVEGGSVAFSPLLVDSSYTYQWVFGDGTQSAEIYPDHTYDAPGIYTVVLIVTSENGCSEAVQQPGFIEVVEEGALSVAFSITQIECEGDDDGSIQAEVLNGEPPFTYAWNNGSTESSISGLSSGTYRLTVTDSQGSMSIKVTQISPIFDTPDAPEVSPDNSSVLCSEQDVILTASSGQVVDQYYWYSDGQLIGTGFSVVVSPEQGNLPIEVQSQEGSCFSPFATIVYDIESLDASFLPDAGTDALVGQSILFNPAQADYAAYNWSFGDGETSAEVQPQHTYTSAGQYEVVLEVESAEGCTAEYSWNLEVLPVDQLLLEFDYTHLLCEESEAGAISVEVSGGVAPYDITWSDGTAGSSISGLSAGIYGLTVTDSDGNMTQTTAELLVMSEVLPTPIVEANGGAPVCKNETAYLSGTVPGYPDATVAWYASLNDLQPIEQSSVLVIGGLADNTTYYTESVVEGCPSARIATEVEVQAPNTDFSIDPGTLLEEGDLVQLIPEEMNNDYSYYWDFGDNGWSTAMSPFYFYNLPGTFDVMLEVVDADGCSDQQIKTEWITVDAYDGLQDDELEGRSGQIEGSRQITGSVFPNPFSNHLTGVFKVDKAGNYRLQLLDAYGKTIVEEQAFLDEQVQNWNLNFTGNFIPSGIYFLSIQGEGERAMVKLIKH